MKDVDDTLKQYIIYNIFPRYDRYYSHGMLHVEKVIDDMLMLADYYDLDKNMAYTIASYHDAGLNVDREHHELESGKLLGNDARLGEFFDKAQIKIMKEAVEDHRGSRKTRPRNFYGECVSDADRDFDIALLAKRQLATSLKNYPDLRTFDEHFERCYQYLLRRINSAGNFNLWTNNPILVERRNQFQKDFLNEALARTIYQAEWNRISSNGTKEKILNYYEDY